MVDVATFGDGFLFLKRFLRHPRTVGAIAPSSRFLALGMVRGLDLRSGARIVEFGPGTGSFTAILSGTAASGGRYLGIERDAAFIARLRTRWPDMEFVHDSVENLVPIAARLGLLPVDHIVSGLPFASLPRDVTAPILDATNAALRPGGTFTTFQYVHAYLFPAARAFRREMRRRFGPPFSRRTVVRNLPPAFALRWRKEESS